MASLDFDSVRQSPAYLLAKGGPGSGWAGPPAGTHIKSSDHVSNEAEARAYWLEHYGGKIIPLKVHFSDPAKAPIPIKVRFDANNDHAYSGDVGGKQKTGIRAFDIDRARAMSRILAVIEHPKARARNYNADLLFEAAVNGRHYTVVLTWRSSAKVYEFHSAHFRSVDDMQRLWRQQDARKNEGPLQKGGPSTVFAGFQDSTEPGDSLQWLPPSLAGNGMHGGSIEDSGQLCKTLDFDSFTKAIKQSDLLAAAARYRASHEPTPAQLAAGNYAKRQMPWRGVSISIEAGWTTFRSRWITVLLLSPPMAA